MHWYQIKNLADGEADIYILEQIGRDWWSDEGIGAKDFIDQVTALGDLSTIRLHINSPGGNVFDGLAIHNYLVRHKARVEVFVDGVAASIASVIAMAGDTIHMPANAMLFIHDPATVAMGNATALRKTADDLDHIKQSLIASYRRSNMSDEAIGELMAAETWLSAEDAVAAGLADQVEEAVKIAANHDVDKAWAQAQQALAPVTKHPTHPAPQRQTPTPIDRTLAQNLAHLPTVLDAYLGGKITAERAKVLQQRASAVNDACVATGIEPQTILDHIEDPAGMVRAAILAVRAEDDPEIQSTLTNPTSGKVPNAAEIYKRRNNHAN